jgi:biopolymer transport protein ExbD
VGQTLPLDLPKASTGSEQQVVFAVEVASSGEMAVNGKKVDGDEAVLALAREARERTPDLRAVIDADEKVAHGRVVKVMDRMKQAGITRIAFGVTASH